MNSLKLDTNRKRVKYCPCGDANKTHFVPYVGFDNKGYCHKCETNFLPELEPKETVFYYVSFNEKIDYSPKAYKLNIGEAVYFLPKSQCLEIGEDYCFASEQIISKNSIPHNASKSKTATANQLPTVQQRKATVPTEIKKPISYIPNNAFIQSLKQDYSIEQAANECNLIKYLVQLFGADIADHLRKTYYLGITEHQFADKDYPNYKSDKGAIVFWQIDEKQKVHTGKIMLYKPDTGKRIREPFNHIYWMHKALKLPDFNLQQCFFGAHLLKDKTKPVAIVESEKTAMIASVYLPQFIWLAFGGIGFKVEMCNVLKGRNVVLFPDLSKPKNATQTAFEMWSAKAKEMEHLAKFSVSDLLERKATPQERANGLDIADYLTKFDWQLFRQNDIQQPQPQPEFEKREPPKAVIVSTVIDLPKNEHRERQNWSNDIAALEQYFASIQLPNKPIQLYAGTTIISPFEFVASHIETIKANYGNKTFLPHLNRLQALKQLLTFNTF